jgi:hypothetical protein
LTLRFREAAATEFPVRGNDHDERRKQIIIDGAGPAPPTVDFLAKEPGHNAARRRRDDLP